MLFERKDELSKNIKTIKDDIKSLDDKLIKSIVKSDYEGSISVLNVTSKVDEVNIRWDKKKGDFLVVDVKVKDNDNTDRWSSSSFMKDVNVRIDKSDSKVHYELENRLEELKTELTEVMGLIKSVSRKERQVRGRISEMKLAESGFSGLLESPELLKLIEL